LVLDLDEEQHVFVVDEKSTHEI